MAKQTVNLGTAPTGVNGDTNRSAATKFQANDNEIYNFLGNGSVLPSALAVNKGGTGATTASDARTNLGLGTAATKNIGEATGDALGFGSLGLGQYRVLNIDKLSDAPPSGFYLTPRLSSITVDRPAFSTNLRSMLIAVGSPGLGPNIYALQILADGNEMFMRFGTKDNNYSSVPWWRFRSTKNTTVDGNGFLKNASPIVQLFADHIELNYDAEKQEITFTKNATGDYLVSGSLGFAQEGWYIEMPKDANGNVLVAVVYEQLSNNNISVKTYKKKFDLETTSIVADLDNPIDIPAGRWIDLRLEDLPVEPTQEGTPNEPNE